MNNKSESTFFVFAKNANWNYDEDTKQWTLEVESCDQLTITNSDTEIEFHLVDGLNREPIDETEEQP